MIKKVNNKSKKGKKKVKISIKEDLGEIIVYFIEIETPKQVFSWDFCKILKDTYFEEHLRTAASASGQNEFRIMPNFTGTGYFRDSFGSINIQVPGPVLLLFYIIRYLDLPNLPPFILENLFLNRNLFFIEIRHNLILFS